MKFIHQASLATVAIFAAFASALPSPEPNADALAVTEHETVENILIKRAARPSWCPTANKWFCAGGTGGSNFGDACACIDKISTSKIRVRMYVKDTLTNGKDVWAYTNVYRNGAKWKESGKLEDVQGYGTTGGWIPYEVSVV